MVAGGRAGIFDASHLHQHRGGEDGFLDVRYRAAFTAEPKAPLAHLSETIAELGCPAFSTTTPLVVV
jgi:hypothetical protein